MRPTSYREMPDAELWTEWKRGGDPKAGGALCDRYFFPTLRFFGPKVRTDRDAEDLTQKTFLELVRSTAEPSTVTGYIFGVARFVLLRYIRGLQREPTSIDSERSSLSELDPGPGVTTLVAQSAQRSRLVLALRQLPIDMQILLELHYWEELSGAELAVALEVPEGTVRSRLGAAKRRLGATLVGIASTSPEGSNLEGWIQTMRAAAPRRAV